MLISQRFLDTTNNKRKILYEHKSRITVGRKEKPELY